MRYREVRKQNLLKPPRSRRAIYIAIFLGVIFFLSFLVINPAVALKGFLNPISVFSKITGAGKLASFNSRTNILVLGLDKRSRDEVGLSDTIIVVSLSANKGDVALLSVPRDVWIKNYRSKVNGLYAIGGVDLARKTISDMLDLPIHYYVVVDFSGFEKAVDVLDGVEVNVERDFEDFRYPISGLESDDCGGSDPEFKCRFEYLGFKKGLQKMDGLQALKFSRSRQSSGPEGSDFARDSRQQKVMVAFKNKALSLSTLINPATIAKLYEQYKVSIETNIGLIEAEKFFDLSEKIKDGNIKSYVINKNNTGEEILLAPSDLSPFEGAWVLLPRTTDFSEVRAFVQKALYGGR